MSGYWCPPALTDDEHNALHFIANYLWVHGYQPLYSEIGSHLGVSERSARDVVIKLELKRYLNRAPKQIYLIRVPNFSHARQFRQESAA